MNPCCPPDPGARRRAPWLALGTGLGLAAGTALHHMPQGLALGAGLGALLAYGPFPRRRNSGERP